MTRTSIAPSSTGRYYAAASTGSQKPKPFPWSIRTNILYGAELKGLVTNRREKNELVEKCLHAVDMWDEVKDRLREPGTDLSGGQQQRLCIARAIANQPEVLLMNEPRSALDPGSTALIENLVDELRVDYAIVIVIPKMRQAGRISQWAAFFHLSNLMGVGDTRVIFLYARRPCTASISFRAATGEKAQDFISSRIVKRSI